MLVDELNKADWEQIAGYLSGEMEINETKHCFIKFEKTCLFLVQQGIQTATINDMVALVEADILA